MTFRMSMTNTTLLLLCLLAVVCASKSLHEIRQDVIRELYAKTSDLQAKQDEPLRPFRNWYKQKGVYESYIKNNFHGKLEMMEARRLVNIYDNNMFVTTWVTTALLESTWYQNDVQPSAWQLDAALEAIYTHRNKNKQNNTAAYSFWDQSYNKTVKFWTTAPANLMELLALIDDLPVNLIADILAGVGLKNFANELKQLYGMETVLKVSIHIPSDSDDTFVNLGLGTLLYGMRSRYPDAWAKWSKHNSDVPSALTLLKHYAYRPFSNNNDSNTIDPRSYYVLRQFLDKAHEAKQDVAVVTTWLQTITECRTQYFRGMTMPHQVNNVDLAVGANTIYGVTSAILSGIMDPKVLDDPEVVKIYLNTSSMLAHELRNNLTSRLDLALLYYPSQYELDWFVSRTVDLIGTYMLSHTLPHPAIKSAYTILKNATEGAMTDQLLLDAKKDGAKYVYFDDFLGNSDIDLEKKPVNRAEDRMFTTAMATNAFLYTWTTCNQKRKCEWKAEVPDKVKTAVDGSIQWLTKYALKDTYKPWNAFFSGSTKFNTTFPMWYPGNRLEYINGTTITDWSKLPASSDYVYGMQGYVTKKEYDAMLKQPHFGVMTPQTFDGFNAHEGGFLLWTADALTYVGTMIALSRYNCIVVN